MNILTEHTMETLFKLYFLQLSHNWPRSRKGHCQGFQFEPPDLVYGEKIGGLVPFPAL